MKDFIDENALAIFGVVLMGCWAMTATLNPTQSNIVSLAIGGLLGYIKREQK